MGEKFETLDDYQKRGSKENVSKEIKVSFLYPIVACKVKFHVSEVKKPSHIARILLELIQSKTNKLFHKELNYFGIPQELHHIFAKELLSLYQLDIVKYRNGDVYSINLFRNSHISEFNFTESGANVYKSNQILTGKTKVVNHSIYVDVFKTKTLLEEPKGIRLLGKTIISEFVPHEYSSDDLDLLQNFQTLKINGSIKVKKEEGLEKAEIEGQELKALSVKKAITLNITKDDIEFSNYETEKLEEYIKNDLDSTKIENYLNNLSDFQFPKNFIPPQIDNFSDLGDIMSINTPRELEVAFEKYGIILIDAHKFDVKLNKRIIQITDDNYLKVIEKRCGYPLSARIEQDKIVLISPCQYSLNNNLFDEKINLNLILEIKLNETLTKNIIDDFASIILNTQLKNLNYKILRIVRNYNNSIEIYQKYFEKMKLDKLNENEISDFAQKLIEDPDWKDYYEEYSQKLFDESLETLTIDNIKEIYHNSKHTFKSKGINEADQINMLSKNLDKDENCEFLFDTFENLCFPSPIKNSGKKKKQNKTNKKVGNPTNHGILLNYFNIVNYYMEFIINHEDIEVKYETSLTKKFKTLASSFEKVCNITDIKDTIDYDIPYNFEYDKFINSLITLNKNRKEFTFYQSWSKDEFDELDSFIGIFDGLKDYAHSQRDVYENIENITKEFIQEKIEKVDYKNALTDMCIFLEYKLRAYYDTEISKLYELLKDAKDEELLSEENFVTLSNLRKCRNQYSHPSGKREELTSEKLNNWCNVLYKFIGELDE